jgi:hypothetical protein
MTCRTTVHDFHCPRLVRPTRHYEVRGPVVLQRVPTAKMASRLLAPRSRENSRTCGRDSTEKLLPVALPQ